MKRIFSAILWLIAAPVLFVCRFLHRRLTGKKGVLVIDIEPLDDVYERQLFMDRLRRIALDPRIVAVVFKFEGVPGGWASRRNRENLAGENRASAARRIPPPIPSPANPSRGR